MEDILAKLQEQKRAPQWLTVEGFSTLSGGYLENGETPVDSYWRAANASAARLKRPELAQPFFEMIWNGWLGMATPVASNMGTNRGTPISCLTADSMINTITGGKIIEELEIGDLVLTHEGRWKPVIDKQVRKSTDDLYELIVSGRTTRIKITGNHPVLTNKGWVRVDELDRAQHLIATNLTAKYAEKEFTINLAKHCPYEWFETDDGKLCRPIRGEKLLRRIEQESTKNRVATIIAEEKLYARGDVGQPIKSVKIDKDLAWALGLWFAEGSRSIDSFKKPNGIRITLNLKERPVAERWLHIMESKFNLHGSISETRRISSWLSVNLNSTALGTWFCEEFGVGCKKKSLPLWLLNLPKDQLESFIDGFYLGDGHIDTNGNYTATISNPQLCLGLYNIALKLGIKCKLNLHTKAGSLSTVKHVQTLVLVKRGLPGQTEQKLSAKQGIEFGGLIYAGICSLKKLTHNEDVYDITVADDHSFSVAGVVVHNCYSIQPADSIPGIFVGGLYEFARLASKGGGIAYHLDLIRPEGAPIGVDGISGGVVPWCKVMDSAVLAVNQGTRRGAAAFYLNVNHKDFPDFLRIRRPEGDVNRQCLNSHHGANIPDEFMQRVTKGDPEARKLWVDILKTRIETGEPYLFFSDTVNRYRPQWYINKGFYVNGSNLCSEILGMTDALHSFVCCLSSLNLAKYDEWKNTKTIQLATWFLDGVMQEFIDKAYDHDGAIDGLGADGFLRTRNFAIKSRMLGLGVLGYHSYLQQNSIPFESDAARQFNKQFFAEMERETIIASKDMARELGEPEWLKGYGMRNSHLRAVAPTTSNSIICGNVSAGIEPTHNMVVKKTSKGTFRQRNPELEKIINAFALPSDRDGVWAKIRADNNSVANIDFLSEHQKAVFKSPIEINQMEIIRQAADRAPLLDQSQSVNLFFKKGVSQAELNKVHYAAWKLEVRTLYYCRSEAANAIKEEPPAKKVWFEPAVEAANAERKEVECTDDVCLVCQG